MQSNVIPEGIGKLLGSSVIDFILAQIHSLSKIIENHKNGEKILETLLVTKRTMKVVFF